MTEENISQELRLKNRDEKRKYFIEKMKQNELIIKKYKKVCKTLTYIEHLHILVSTVTGCVSVSAFASLVGIPVAIISSAVGLKITAISTVVKNYKSIIKKRKSNMIKYYC